LIEESSGLGGGGGGGSFKLTFAESIPSGESETDARGESMEERKKERKEVTRGGRGEIRALPRAYR